MSEPETPRTPPTDPGSMPQRHEVRRPIVVHVAIALAAPVLAAIVAALIGPPMPIVAWFGLLLPFALVLAIEVMRERQSPVRHVAVVTAPAIVMLCMVVAIQTSTSSTAVLGYLFAPFWIACAAGLSYGLVVLGEWLLRDGPATARWSIIIAAMAVLGATPGVLTWAAAGVEAARAQALVEDITGRTVELAAAWSVPGFWTAVTADDENGVIYASMRNGQCIRIDPSGATLGRFSLAPAERVVSVEYIAAAQLADGGDRELLASRGGWPDNVTARRADGSMLWTYRPGAAVDDVWFADLDGDGIDEVIVGCNASGGVHVLAGDGTRRWQSSAIGNVWSVRGGDLDGDGRVEIVATSAAGTVHVFDAGGKMIATLDPGIRAHAVCVAGGGASGAAPVAVAGPMASGGTFAAVGFDGGRRWSIELPGSRYTWMAPATTRPWLAVTTGDAEVYVLDVRNGEIVGVARGRGGVTQVDWLESSPDEPPLLLIADVAAVTAFRAPEE